MNSEQNARRNAAKYFVRRERLFIYQTANSLPERFSCLIGGSSVIQHFINSNETNSQSTYAYNKSTSSRGPELLICILYVFNIACDKRAL